MTRVGVIEKWTPARDPARRARSASATSISGATPTPPLRADLEHAAGSSAGRVTSPARSAPLAAHCGSERRSERRPVFEICGSPHRSGNCRLRLPCIHENALLRVGRLDNGRADDGSGPAGGEERGRPKFGELSCFASDTSFAGFTYRSSRAAVAAPASVKRRVKPSCRRALPGHRLAETRSDGSSSTLPPSASTALDDLDGSDLGDCCRGGSVTGPDFTTRACPAAL